MKLSGWQQRCVRLCRRPLTSKRYTATHASPPLCCPTSSSAADPAGFHQPVLHLSWAAPALAALLLCCAPLSPPAHASTVRLEDVENPRMQEGVRAATQGEFGRAENIFRSMLEDDASSASTWSNLGNVLMSQGRASEAVVGYDQAVELAPDAPVPYLNRAIALEQLGLELERQGQEESAHSRWQAAVADCDAAIQRDPLEYAAYFNKGNVEMRLQEYEAAEDDYRRAADLAPGIPGYRLRQAQVVFQNSKNDAAMRLTRSVTRKNPNYAEAYASLAAMLYQDGRVAQAEDAYNKATELEPSFRRMDFVLENTRWPPRLTQVFEQFLQLGAVGQG